MDLEEAQSLLYSCLASAKGDVLVKTVSRDFEELVGEPIPFRKHGFKSVNEFVAAVPNVRLFSSGGCDYVKALATENSGHIIQLVKGQKSSKKGKTMFNKKSKPNYRWTENTKKWGVADRERPHNESAWENSENSQRTDNRLRNTKEHRRMLNGHNNTLQADDICRNKNQLGDTRVERRQSLDNKRDSRYSEDTRTDYERGLENRTEPRYNEGKKIGNFRQSNNRRESQHFKDTMIDYEEPQYREYKRIENQLSNSRRDTQDSEDTRRDYASFAGNRRELRYSDDTRIESRQQLDKRQHLQNLRPDNTRDSQYSEGKEINYVGRSESRKKAQYIDDTRFEKLRLADNTIDSQCYVDTERDYDPHSRSRNLQYTDSIRKERRLRNLKGGYINEARVENQRQLDYRQHKTDSEYCEDAEDYGRLSRSRTSQYTEDLDHVHRGGYIDNTSIDNQRQLYDRRHSQSVRRPYVAETRFFRENDVYEHRLDDLKVTVKNSGEREVDVHEDRLNIGSSLKVTFKNSGRREVKFVGTFDKDDEDFDEDDEDFDEDDEDFDEV